MKHETDVVSTHQSRNEKSSLLQYFPFTNPRLESAAFSSYRYSVSLLSGTNLIFDLSESNFASCPYLHISFVFGAFHRARFIAFLSQVLLGLTFTIPFTNLQTKLDGSHLLQNPFIHFPQIV